MYYCEVAHYGYIEVGREGDGPRLGEQAEPVREWVLAVRLRVIVRAVRLLAGVSMEARFDLEVVWVELLLFPAVAVRAPVLVLAAVFIRGDEFLGVPKRAHILAIGEYRGLPAVVLPVVGVDADVPLVVVLPVGAPHGLEVKDIEIHVWLELLYELY